LFQIKAESLVFYPLVEVTHLRPKKQTSDRSVKIFDISDTFKILPQEMQVQADPRMHV